MEQNQLFVSNPERFFFFPVKFPKLYKFFQYAQETFWSTREICLTQDEEDFKKLSAGEQKFLKTILTFFLFADGVVGENLASRFQREVQIPEARAFYALQGAIESVHAEVYSLLFDTLISDPEERERLRKSVDEKPSMMRKKEWILKWVESEAPFFVRLIAFAIVEGVFFSGSFAAIFKLRQRGLCKGLCDSNEFIARDEALHCNFAVLLEEMFAGNEKPPQEEIHRMMREAVEIEEDFFRDGLKEPFLEINFDSMTRYIRFIADRLLHELGYAKIYHVENSLDFMMNISLEGKSNMFEKGVSEYSLSADDERPLQY